MSFDRRSRGVRGVLVFVAVGLAACLVGSMGQVYGHTFHGELYCVHD